VWSNTEKLIVTAPPENSRGYKTYMWWVCAFGALKPQDIDAKSHRFVLEIALFHALTLTMA
jgi:hypothetical protein